MFNSEDIYRLIGEIGIDKLKENLIRVGLRNSRIINNLSYEIVNSNVEFILPEYAKLIETGRRANSKPPPIKPIQEWLNRKNLPMNPYAVAINIGKRGIVPRPFIDSSLNETAIEFETELSLYILDNLSNNIKEINTNNFKF